MFTAGFEFTEGCLKKKQLAEELRESKRVQKELLNQLEEASTNEMIAKGDLNPLTHILTDNCGYALSFISRYCQRS